MKLTFKVVKLNSGDVGPTHAAAHNLIALEYDSGSFITIKLMQRACNDMHY